MLQNVLQPFLVHHWMLAVVRGLCTISLAITLGKMLKAFSAESFCLFCVILSIFFLSLVADKLLIDKLIIVREKSNDRQQSKAS